MGSTSAPKAVRDLVQRFECDRKVFESDDYKEEQLRLEFLNPLFEALGWDVYNRQGLSETYKPVIHEESIKVAGASKAPDYTFRIGGRRVFFTEAKKPSVKVAEDIAPAFQLRRYAWTAKLPVSILTDFEEFAVYDCRIRPFKTDKASVARTMLLSFKDYLTRWDELSSLFSPDAIQKGALERYVESTKIKKGTAAVDDAFLLEISGWRETLARNIALRNPRLSTRELNFAVQRTIDRLIFLRICEDRGIESYAYLQSLLNGTNIYARLRKHFYDADDRYNSGLFHFAEEKGRTESPDRLTLELAIDDKPLKDIISDLYYPDSPYEFSVMPAEVLGQVYEQFLGKVIRLTAGHQAKVEDKPEVRKAGGVYYTPAYIVDYIVKNTVGKLVEGKTPAEAAKLRILDPACGSGSFLLGAYQYLLDWHLDYYQKERGRGSGARGQGPTYKDASGNLRLTTAERKQILLNNIYGVDIDSQAVEVTKLSLLLKVLEGENQETLQNQLRFFKERALPDLGSNIKCGNSLIGSDYRDHVQSDLFNDEEERAKVNAFDWKVGFASTMERGGFDAVIGNPPYDVMEKERGASSWPHSVLAEYVRLKPDYAHALGGKLNLYRFFVVQSLTLTRPGGRYGMIVPLSLLADISCARTRRFLLQSAREIEADCFPQKDNASRRVFLKAKLSTVVLVCSRSDRKHGYLARMTTRVYPWNSYADPPKVNVATAGDLALLDPENLPVPLVDAASWRLCRKVHTAKKVKRMAEVPDFRVTRGEINQTVYREFIVSDARRARLLKGVEVGQYCIHDKLKQGEREWFDARSYGKVHGDKPVIHEVRIATQRITGVDEGLRVVATVVEPPVYFADSTNSVALAADSHYRLEYALGLLNSTLFQWRFKLTSTNNNVGTNELESLPFRTIDFSDKADKAKHDKMVRLVERMLDLHKQLPKAKTPHERESVERQIAATDKQVDALVYDLYGLTEEEVRIVEGAT